MLKTKPSCKACAAYLAPGEGCDTHGGVFCDPHAARSCPRCGAALPPLDNWENECLIPFVANKECKKCTLSSKKMGLAMELYEADRAIEKLQKRIDELSQPEGLE